MTVLDALIRIKNECDGSLALRYSCRSAICGSCAMTINGSEKLACRTSLRKELERHGHITVAPLRNLPVIKDLVVDMASFWEKIRDVHPWLYRSARPAETLWRDPAQLTILPRIRSFTMWMPASCAAPVSRPVPCMKSRRGLLGPAALAKADRFLSDPRESPSATARAGCRRFKTSMGSGTVRAAISVCEVCPKDVKPMEAIVRLRRASLERGLTSDRRRAPRPWLYRSDRTARALERSAHAAESGRVRAAWLLACPASGYQDVAERENPQSLRTCAPGLSHLQALIRRVRRAMPPA